VERDRGAQVRPDKNTMATAGGQHGATSPEIMKRPVLTATCSGARPPKDGTMNRRQRLERREAHLGAERIAELVRAAAARRLVRAMSDNGFTLTVIGGKVWSVRGNLGPNISRRRNSRMPRER
jgi:hypothetical protein